MKQNFALFIIALISFATITSCTPGASSGGSESKKNEKIAQENSFVMVGAETETAPVESTEDAADDMAIWYNHNDPSESAIIATNKKTGLVVYDLDGQELFNYPVGRVNNVDIKTKFGLGNDSITIVGATNRTDNTITLRKLNTETRELEELEISGEFKPKSSEVYGFCLYRVSHKTRFIKDHFHKMYAISVGTDGMLDQWELVNDNGKVKPRYARVLKFDTQCEGMVADDETGKLFVGEEGKGIWKLPALPAEGDTKELIADVAKTKLEPDVEGLTIYYGADNKGYLIASSQGNNSFAVFTRGGNHKYLGSFMITANGGIDGVSETDGIDVMNLALGSDFPDGVFIAQDGYNFDGEQQVNQNFKLVNWKEVASQFKPWLLIDNAYVPAKDQVVE
jgi:3-phytase